ncbi:MAG: sulfatase/phosphatase domain-containing protein, partial [Planctomycetota bacterium]
CALPIYPDLMDGPEPEGRFNGSRTDLKKLDTLPQSLRLKEDMDRIKYLYDGEVRYCDLWIQRLFEGIFSLGLDLQKNMLVVLTADHGEGLWDHGERSHGRAPHVEQIHVPLVIRLPNPTEPAHCRISQPVSLIDLAPTILSICGIPQPSQFQGHSLCPLMEGKKRDGALDLIYSEIKYKTTNYESLLWNGKKTIHDRTPDLQPRTAYRFYDLIKDPFEQADLNLDLSFAPWSQEQIKALHMWSEAIKKENDFLNKIDVNNLDEETLENLRALGYIGS